MKTKLGGKFWTGMVIFGLMGQIAWVVENMYFNVFIYKIFHASAGAISTMVAASAIAATLTTWLIGTLSDQIGKRKLIICVGYICWGISILAFMLLRMDVLTPIAGSTAVAMSMGTTLVIVMDCVMTFFGSSANDAAYNAWLTDTGDETNRGAIEGINAMMPMIAVLCVFGGFMSFDLDKQESWTTIYLIIGLAVIVIGILGFFLIEEKNKPQNSGKGYWYNLTYCFRGSVVKDNKLLYAVIGCYAVFGIAIQVFMPYLILYYEEFLGLDNYVLIMAPAIVMAALVTALYGKTFDKFGFEKSVIPTLLMLIVGFAFMALFKATPLVFIGSFIMMSGYLSGMAIFGAMIRDNTPAQQTGLFQGVRIFGQVLIPGVTGPSIGAAVLKNADIIVNNDGTTSFIPNQNIYWAALVVAVVVLIVLIPIFKMIKKIEK